MLARLKLEEARRLADPFHYAPLNREAFGSFHSALLARLGLSNSQVSQSSLLAAINHPSIHNTSAHQFYLYKRLGQTALNFKAAEHIHFRWPSICNRERQRLQEAYTGRESICRVGQNWGISAYYEFPKEPLLVLESTLGLFGLLCTTFSEQRWHQWLQVNLLETDYLGNISVFLQGDNPSVKLNLLMKRFGMPPVEHRLVAETGRGTEGAAFAVNAYCGTELLGQGVGRTLEAARKNANEVAFANLTLKKEEDARVPSEGGSEWNREFTDCI